MKKTTFAKTLVFAATLLSSSHIGSSVDTSNCIGGFKTVFDSIGGEFVDTCTMIDLNHNCIAQNYQCLTALCSVVDTVTTAQAAHAASLANLTSMVETLT